MVNKTMFSAVAHKSTFRITRWNVFNGCNTNHGRKTKWSGDSRWRILNRLKGKIKIVLPGIQVKFIYSEKATKFCEIFPLLLTTVHTVKSKGNISQNFVAFSEYMNFTTRQSCAVYATCGHQLCVVM